MPTSHTLPSGLIPTPAQVAGPMPRARQGTFPVGENPHLTHRHPPLPLPRSGDRAEAVAPAGRDRGKPQLGTRFELAAFEQPESRSQPITHHPDGISHPVRPPAVRVTPALTWQHPEPPQNPAPEQPLAPAPHGTFLAAGTELRLSLSQGSDATGGGSVSEHSPGRGGTRVPRALPGALTAPRPHSPPWRWPHPSPGDPLMLGDTHFATGGFKAPSRVTPWLTPQGWGPQPLGSIRWAAKSPGKKALGWQAGTGVPSISGRGGSALEPCTPNPPHPFAAGSLPRLAKQLITPGRGGLTAKEEEGRSSLPPPPRGPTR